MSREALEQPPGPVPLQYSRRRPLRFFSRHPRLFVFAALCIAVGVSWYLWWTPLEYRIRWWYWTRQAMSYQMPVTSLDVRITDQAQAKKMPVENPDFVLFQSPNRVDAVFAPKAFRALSELDPKIRAGGVWNHRGALTFMGMLMRPDGTPRLVIIPGSEGVHVGYPGEGIGYVVTPPTGLFDPLPAKLKGPGITSIHMDSASRYETKTAVRDSADPTHLIIPLNRAFDPSPYQVDAYLLNNDTLSIRINKAAPRPTTAGDTFIEIGTIGTPATKGSTTLGFSRSNAGLILPQTTQPATPGGR